MHMTPYKGISIAAVILIFWLINLYYLLQLEIHYTNLFIYLLILVQTHLYTGLFITAHDAMHGTVIPNYLKINDWIGKVFLFLYAALNYQKIKQKHFYHHRYVHTAQDPDFYQGSFWIWYLKFVQEYVSFYQICFLALLFNIAKIGVNETNLYLFWVIPSLLSTLQLFYFGTYLPHKGEHTNIYQSNSQKKNHLLAFFSCYFFGYHYEHHAKPFLPWWALWKAKEKEF